MSVGEDRDGNYVFVLEPADNNLFVARRRTVEIGRIVPAGLLISSGLSEGELIATAGVRRITEGQELRLDDN